MPRREFPSPQCSIEDCERRSSTAGLCRTHYERNRLYGSPLGGGRFYRPWGERKAFVQTAIVYAGDDCLLWPFSHNGNGYPSYSIGRKKAYAHRIVCEAVHGSPPTQDAEAAHNCGNGRLGCITPRHLRWATTLENAADTVAMGRSQRGEKQHQAKLTEIQARYVLSLKGRRTCRSLGYELGVAPQTVHDIWRSKSWAWVQ